MNNHKELQPIIDWAIKNNIPETKLPRDCDKLFALTELYLSEN
jgi:hypothetical protein